MKRNKLRRSRRSVFGRREMPRALKTLIWIVVCVAVVATGYFGAKIASEGGLSKPDAQPPQTDSPIVSPDEDKTPTIPSDTPNVDEGLNSETPPANNEALRAFYLPVSELSVDSLTDTSTLQDAATAGFNAVVFDLKDADGTLYYEFTCPQAKKVNAYAPNALTADNLTTLFSMIHQAGLQVIPRLYAFRDDLGAKALSDARVMLESNHSWGWYDDDPNDGGRRWLNPYAEAAHAYIGALVNELKEKGADAIMLDGVEFPSQTSSAYFGEDAATVSKNDILSTFVEKMRDLLSEECPLLLSCSAKSALGTDTKVYGGNPLTFGASVASPLLSDPSKIKESVEKMILRTQVLEQQTILAPMLAVEGLSFSKVNDAIGGVVVGGTDSFILYATDGNYDFASYNLP